MNDLDLRLKRSQVALTPDHGLLQSLLFLHKTFPLILEQSFSGERPHSGQTGKHDLCRQFRLLLLHPGLVVLKHAPFLFEAFNTRNERLHLHLQFDAFSPEELTSLLFLIPWLLPMLMLLVFLVALIMGLVLTHDGTFLSCFALPEVSSTKEDRISPSGVSSGLYASFPLLFRLYDDR